MPQCKGLEEGLANFSVKGQTVNISDFAGHIGSVKITQQCHCSVKATINNMQKNECDYVPIKHYLQKQAVC